MIITKSDIKRILQYFVVVICCILVGCFIGIDYLNLSLNDIIKIISARKNLLYILIISLQYFMFLMEYVLRYNSQKDKSAPFSLFVEGVLLIILFIMGDFRTPNTNCYIALSISLISLVSSLFYHYLSDISLNIVRFELIWPSLYIVAISIYTGYSLIKYGLVENESANLLTSYFIFMVYTFFVFCSMGSDKEVCKFKFYKKIHDSKRRNGSILLVHIIATFGLFFHALMNEDIVVIVFLGFGISFVMTIFETWDVASRRNFEKRHEYDVVLGFVSSVLLVTMTVIMTTADKIKVYYVVVIICALLISNIISVILSEHNYFAQNENRQKFNSIIDKIKVVSYILMAFFISFPGLSRNISFQIDTDALGMVTFKQIEKWKILDISTILAIVLAFPAIFKNSKLIIEKFQKSNIFRNDSKLGIIKKIFSFCDIELLLFLHALSCCVCIIWGYLLYANSEMTTICAQKVVILHYLFIFFAFVYFFMCLWYNLKHTNNDSDKRVETNEIFEPKCEQNENEPQVNINLYIIKILQMLHLPSCILLILLLMIPSLQNNNSVAISLLTAAPFVLAAMGSFALNDYYDYEKDKINKPDRILPLGLIKRETAKKIGLSILFSSFIIAVFASNDYMELTMYWSTILLSALYSRFIKQISPIKTFYTAAVLSVPFVFSAVRWGHINALWLYALGVFTHVVGKEMMMDIFDYEGDKNDGMKTLAILLGEKKSLLIAAFCHICSFLCFLYAYSAPSNQLIYYGLFVAVVCYLLWLSGNRKIQRITVYGFWIPLILYTVQGW